MINKLLSLILCAIILLCFAACNKDTTSNISSTENASLNQTTTKLEVNDNPDESVFNTQNIGSITLYAYYGQGTGSKVPSENMTEITNWLSTITIDRKAIDKYVPPGTNTYCVEIEYLDGTIIKNGLDEILVDGIRYLLKKDKYPDCFMEIISKTSYK